MMIIRFIGIVIRLDKKKKKENYIRVVGYRKKVFYVAESFSLLFLIVDFGLYTLESIYI